MAAWVLWLTLLASALRPAHAAELSLTFFDIGQGDAALIVSPSGKRVLIDGGPPESGPRLLAALQRRGVSALDLIILTHPHMDHLGGLKDVVGALPVRMFLDAAFPSTSPGYVALLKLLEERRVAMLQAVPERRIDIGEGAALRLLGPPTPWLSNTRSDINANSVLVRLAWGPRSALFTGDAEPETERWLLERYAGSPETLRAEVLKVPHHGGRFSSTAAFLGVAQPQLAVISVGRNDYGHPTAEALSRLSEQRARVLRTDQLGDITLTSRDQQPWQLSTTAPLERAAAVAMTPAPRPPGRPREPGPPSAAGFVGSRRTQVFHRRDCAGALQIQLDNRVEFPSREAALAAGRRPAADCRP